MTPDLMPPSLDIDLVERLINLTDEIVVQLDTGLDPDDLIAEFNNISNCEYTYEEFDTLPGTTTTETGVLREFHSSPDLA